MPPYNTVEKSKLIKNCTHRVFVLEDKFPEFELMEEEEDPDRDPCVAPILV